MLSRWHYLKNKQPVYGVVSYSADYQRKAGTLKIESFSKEPKTLTVGGIPAMKKHAYRAQKVNNINWQQFNIHAQRTWNCINPLEGGQAVLHRRQA